MSFSVSLGICTLRIASCDVGKYSLLLVTGHVLRKNATDIVVNVNRMSWSAHGICSPCAAPISPIPSGAVWPLSNIHIMREPSDPPTTHCLHIDERRTVTMLCYVHHAYDISHSLMWKTIFHLSAAQYFGMDENRKHIQNSKFHIQNTYRWSTHRYRVQSSSISGGDGSSSSSIEIEVFIVFGIQHTSLAVLCSADIK